jgi:3-ketosteroid 9alpha-monooxygenase subunit B
MENDTEYPLVVEFDGERHELQWPSAVPLSDFLKSRGIKVPYACGEGFCGACIARLTSGSVTMPINEILDEDDLANDLILGCQALPEGDAPIEVVYD